MSLIPCSRQCQHQSDGYCSLEIDTVITNTSGGCPHYVYTKKTFIRENTEYNDKNSDFL